MKFTAVFSTTPANPGYQFYDETGLVGVRVTAGIVNVLGPVYVAEATPPAGAVGILWTNDAPATRYAAEDIQLRVLAEAYLDAAVSSAVAASATALTAYDPPTRTEATADKAEVLAAIAGIEVDVPTVGEIADAVWDEANADHDTDDTFGELVNRLDIDTDEVIPIPVPGVGMTYSEFKLFVCAALQRRASDFVVDSTDLLKLSVNMARKNIERKRDFEMSKTVVELDVPVGGSADLGDAVLFGTDTAVSIKSILNVQISTDGTNYFPIDYIGRQTHFHQVSRAYDGLTEADEQISRQPTATGTFKLVRMGNTVYLSPSDTDSYSGATTVKVKMDVVKWLDDYASDDATDFLLEHCVDYLMLETFRYLQMFIHDDARLKVSDDALGKAWHAVVAWDSNLTVGDVVDATLD